MRRLSLRCVPTQASAAPAGPKPLSETVLLARAAADGDVLATRRLIEALAPRLLRLVGVVLGHGHPDVHDVLQHSLLALVQALPSFRGECEPFYFASRITMRTAIAAGRQNRKNQGRRDEEADIERVASSRPLPSDEAGAGHRKQLVRDLLEEIPDEQAESLALRFMLGWSLEEVAAATNAPVNTVRSRIRLAKVALRRRIAAEPALAEALEVEA